MNLKQLEAFVQIAEGKSFSKAAKELFLTQPTISAHILSLEKELNVRLFVRNTKEVNLSEEGGILYQYARQMIDLEQEIENVFGKSSIKGQQCIRIAASTIPSQYLLPEILSKFSEKYPKEQFNITQTDSTGAVEEVVNHKVDIGFTGTKIEKKNCKYIPFYKDELVVITPTTAKFKQLQESNESLQWVQDEAFIMREEGSGTRKEAEKQLKLSGIDTEKINVVASIENQETIKKSVKNGLGISVISKLAAEEEIEDQSLLYFPFESVKNGRDLFVVYNRNFQLPRAAERFLKVIKEMYNN